MAEEFLYELLQMHNSVHDPEERCGICLEEYGSLSRETGTIEVGIRLPCNHTIGSACISIWLKSNNTCPVCRHEFFPAQPRPYLEHGIMDAQDYEEESEGEQPDFRELNEDCCTQLGLDMEISMISGLIVQKLTESGNFNEGHTEWCIVAVSIYMASCLTGEPRSPREIAAVTGVDVDHIRFSYDLIYPEREHLADADLLSLLEDAFDEVAPLNWPAPGWELTDEQIENNHVSQMLKQGCEEACDELGLGLEVTEFSNRIAEKMYAEGFMIHLSPRLMTAASIFMASHMVCCPVGARRVAEAIGTSEPDVCSAYGLAYVNRYQLIEEEWLEDIGRGNIESVFGRLPNP